MCVCSMCCRKISAINPEDGAPIASYITNIFRKTDLKITFRTRNTIESLLSCKNHTPDKFSLLGVYKLNCLDCHKVYVGQTGRCFTAHFKEQEAAFRNNCHTSNFAKHLIEEGHSFGPIHSIIQVLHYHRKGAHLNILERFHIHTESAANNHLDDNHTILPNAIFDTLARNKNSHKMLPAPNKNTPQRAHTQGLHHHTIPGPHNRVHTDHTYVVMIHSSFYPACVLE